MMRQRGLFHYNGHRLGLFTNISYVHAPRTVWSATTHHFSTISIHTVRRGWSRFCPAAVSWFIFSCSWDFVLGLPAFGLNTFFRN